MSSHEQYAAGKIQPRSRSDIFEKSSDDEEDSEEQEESTGKLPADFDELPIELVSLTDRYAYQPRSYRSYSQRSKTGY